MAKHNELGKLGEKVAARHLMLRGYSILAMDWRQGHKDLDLVAMKDGTTVFVEVKTRTNEDLNKPEEAVDEQKMRNLISAAQAYMTRNRVEGPVRFDVIAIVGTEEPYKITHFENAFDSHSLTLLRDGGVFTKFM